MAPRKKSKKSKSRKSLKCNKPVKSYKPGKKRMVRACSKGKEKLIHFGATGYKHNYSAKARRNFRSRHKCSTAKDKLTARYWACKNLWTKGGDKLTRADKSKRLSFTKRRSTSRKKSRRKSRRKSRKKSLRKSRKKSKSKSGRKWSLKYKRSINCNKPRGFSQKQYCKRKRSRSRPRKRSRSPPGCSSYQKKSRASKKHHTKKKRNTYFKNYDLYSDANPKDTIRIKYDTVENTRKTIRKLESLRKNKKYTHARIVQVANVMTQRLRVIYDRTGKGKTRYDMSKRYFEKLKKLSKSKRRKSSSRRKSRKSKRRKSSSRRKSR